MLWKYKSRAWEISAEEHEIASGHTMAEALALDGNAQQKMLFTIPAEKKALGALQKHLGLQLLI